MSEFADRCSACQTLLLVCSACGDPRCFNCDPGECDAPRVPSGGGEGQQKQGLGERIRARVEVDALDMIEAYVLRNSAAARGRAQFVNSLLSLVGEAKRQRSSVRRDVEDFHRALDIPIGETPAIRRTELRASLIEEEAAETCAAIRAGNLVEAIDGMCDVLCVIHGAAIEFGVDLDPFWAEVHRTNMAKVGGAVREDGKRLKPEGWTPPDIAGVLARQTSATPPDGGSKPDPVSDHRAVVREEAGEMLDFEIHAQWHDTEGGYWSASAYVNGSFERCESRVSPFIAVDLACAILTADAERVASATSAERSPKSSPSLASATTKAGQEGQILGGDGRAVYVDEARLAALFWIAHQSLSCLEGSEATEQAVDQNLATADVLRADLVKWIASAQSPLATPSSSDREAVDAAALVQADSEPSEAQGRSVASSVPPSGSLPDTATQGSSDE